MTVLYVASTAALSSDTGFISTRSTNAMASLAASTTATAVFDLGPSWKTMRSVVVAGANLTTSAGATCKATFSADGSATDQTPGMTPNATAGQLIFNTDVATMTFQLLINQRYLRVAFANGATPQGATAKLFVYGHDT